MKLEMMQEKKTVIASAGMHPWAYTNAAKLANSLNGVVSVNDEGHFKATFKSVKKATEFVTAWGAQYEQAQANKSKKPAKTDGNPESGREMTYEQAYNFVYDVAKEKDTLCDIGIMDTLAMLQRKATEAKANGRAKQVEYILVEDGDDFVLKRVKREANEVAKVASNKGKKPTSAKGTRKRKPANAKGDDNSIDFNAFKGTKSEKNKALHAELVSRGMKDSRTAEYQAIWQARPWAKA